MANEEQLRILQQGVDVWNAWRIEHRNNKLDLRRANLRWTNFQGFDLSGTNLSQASLPEANLQGVNFQGATLTEANLQGAIFHGANLRLARLQGSRLHGANLQEALLEGANLTAANLQDSNLIDANLNGASLQSVILYRAKLQGAKLQGVNLQGANLTSADFTRADFTRADFTRADFTNANLLNAKIGYTRFNDLDLRAAQGLDTLRHISPSTIGIDTLYRSQGNIPEIFLRGCGVPDSMIDYVRSLVAAQRPIDYYSVFISYSSTDEAVAQRLHADLQARGVRCWFAPHDLEIGAPIAGGIDEAIRIYDKLLIILSEAAVTSRWVDFEVSTALHREVEPDRTILIPIRLDDAVLHTSRGWAAQLRSRHIGDFRSWKDHDAYQTAFAQLLRDLKAKDHV